MNVEIELHSLCLNGHVTPNLLVKWCLTLAFQTLPVVDLSHRQEFCPKYFTWPLGKGKESLRDALYSMA